MYEKHIPVLLEETVDLLDIKKNNNYIDATFGAGGHSRAILEKNGPQGILLALDMDPAVKTEVLEKKYRERFIFKSTNFNNLEKIVKEIKEKISFHGILFDLGVSSMQLDDKDHRGFSFRENSFLDMRMGKHDDNHPSKFSGTHPSIESLRKEFEQGELTAYHLINQLELPELGRIFKEYGEEKFAYPIAKLIVKIRQKNPISTTQELVEIILKIKQQRDSKIHPATKIFQALRIAVNNELGNISQALEQCLNFLNPKAKIAVISFHSLEDKIVKSFFKTQSQTCICPPKLPFCVCQKKAKLKIVNRKAIKPTEQEIGINPRSRSAKLRVAELV